MKFSSVSIGKKDEKWLSVVNGNSVKIQAGGLDIWENRDEFHFCYMEHTGDFTIAAKLESFRMSDLYAKAGIMARETLEDTSPHVFFTAFPDNSKRNNNNGGYEFQYRQIEGDVSYAIYPSDFTVEPPMHPVFCPQTWLKLIRKENAFLSYSSENGTDWKLYSSYELPLPKKLYLGMAVTSHNENEITTAVFSEVSVI